MSQSVCKKCDACDVTSWPVEASNKSSLHRIGAVRKDNRECRGGRFGGENSIRPATCENHGDLTTSQVCRDVRQAVEWTLRPTVVDRHVLSLRIAGLAHALAEGGSHWRVGTCCRDVKDPNH